MSSHSQSPFPWSSIALILLGLAILAASAMVPGCKTTGAGDGGATAPTVISCSSAAVREHWPRVYPAVMHCLVSVTSAPIACLDSLPDVLRVGLDVVACAVRGVDREAAMQGTEAANDAISVRKVERARAWLDHRGLRFEDAGP